MDKILLRAGDETLEHHCPRFFNANMISAWIISSTGSTSSVALLFKTFLKADFHFFSHILIFDHGLIFFFCMRRLGSHLIKVARVPAWEWNKHAVREAGTVAGKQTLKLSVFPAWTNRSEPRVNAGLCFLHVHRQWHLVMLRTVLFFFF